MAGKSDQTFSFDIVACLLAAMADSGTVVGAKQYALMAKIDGSKTASGYEHMFRAAKNRAKEINQQITKGEVDVGTPSGKAKGGSKSTPASGRKRGRKSAAELEDADDSESPSKKIKAEQKDEDGDEDKV